MLDWKDQQAWELNAFYGTKSDHLENQLYPASALREVQTLPNFASLKALTTGDALGSPFDSFLARFMLVFLNRCVRK